MQGKKEKEEKLFYQVSLDSLVPADHVVRKLDEVLPLNHLYEKTKSFYAHDGKPSIDPVVLFKLYLIGYLFGIPSERRLMKEVQVNMAYRWYIGYDIDEVLPDHSVLTKARRRFPESIFSGFFKDIVRLCQQKGLISGKYHFIDSSMVRANASKNSYRVRLLPVQDYLKQIKDTEEQEYAFNGTVDPEKMGNRRKRIGKANNQQSKTDPEAEIITRPGKGTYPSYKAHACVDGKRRVILAISGTRGSIDDMRKIDYLLTTSMFLSRRKPKYVVADSHYGGIEALKYYQDQGIKPCIRPRSSDSHKNQFRNDQFTLNHEKTELICPGGNRTRRIVKHRFRLQFRFDAKLCSSCNLRYKCTDRKSGRIVSFYSGEYIANAMNLVKSDLGAHLMRRRQTVVEGIWAEAKMLHGLNRCRNRGLASFNIQLYLTAA